MARTIKALLLAALLVALPASGGQIIKKGPGDDRITGTLYLVFFNSDQAGDDGLCATRGVVNPQVCTTGNVHSYFYKYNGTPFFTRLSCRVNARAVAVAAQTLSLNVFTTTGHGVGTAGTTLTPALDLETMADGDLWEMNINELASYADGLVTLEGNFSGAGAGNLDLICALHFR